VFEADFLSRKLYRVATPDLVGNFPGTPLVDFLLGSGVEFCVKQSSQLTRRFAKSTRHFHHGVAALRSQTLQIVLSIQSSAHIRFLLMMSKDGSALADAILCRS
jgi:hypothetical protein